MYTNVRSPIMVIKGDAAKKIFDKPQKNIQNRYEIIKKAKEELRKTGYTM